MLIAQIIRDEHSAPEAAQTTAANDESSAAHPPVETPKVASPASQSPSETPAITTKVTPVTLPALPSPHRVHSTSKPLGTTNDTTPSQTQLIGKDSDIVMDDDAPLPRNSTPKRNTRSTGKSKSQATAPLPIAFPIPIPDALEVRACLEKAPDWLKEVIKHNFAELSSKSKAWAMMSAFWVKHEEMHGFPASSVCTFRAFSFRHAPLTSILQIKSTYLSALERPPEINALIKAGRPFQDGAWTILDVVAFRKEYIIFWRDKQPPWRKVPAEKWLPPKDNANNEGWEKLFGRTGENGLYTIVLSLYWWSLALPNEDFNDIEWVDAVNDVAWVFSRLIQMGPHAYAVAPQSKRRTPGNGDKPPTDSPRSTKKPRIAN